MTDPIQAFGQRMANLTDPHCLRCERPDEECICYQPHLTGPKSEEDPDGYDAVMKDERHGFNPTSWRI